MSHSSSSSSSSDDDCKRKNSKCKGSKRKSKGSKGSKKHSKCEIHDKEAKEVEKLWREHFCTAKLLPVVGYPDVACGVLTLTHGLDEGLIKVDSLKSKAMLLNNGFYSAEVAEGKYLNLYRVTLEDIPGRCGRLSTAQIYINTLAKLCLDVAGVNVSFTGQAKHKKARGLITINHQNVGMNPCEFSRRTICALKKVLKVIKRREKCGSK